MANSKIIKLPFVRSSTWRLLLQRERAIAVYPGGSFPNERFDYLVEDVQPANPHLPMTFVAGRIKCVFETERTLIVTGTGQTYMQINVLEDANIIPDAIPDAIPDDIPDDVLDDILDDIPDDVNMSYLTQARKDTNRHESLLTREEVIPLQAKNT